MIANLVKRLVKENASSAQSQKSYLKKYETLENRYDEAVISLEKLRSEHSKRKQQSREIELFIKTLKKQKLVLETWNTTVWNALVEKAVVCSDKSIKFIFKNGKKIIVEVE